MYVIYHHRTQGNGVEGVHIRGVTKGLMEQGHVVDIISAHGTVSSTDTSGPERKGLKQLFSTVAKNTPEIAFELLEILYNALALAKLARRVKAKRPDLVYERYALFLVSTVWYCRAKRIPVIVEVNDSAVVDRVRPLLLKNVAAALERWVFRNASGLIFVSQRFADIVQRNYGEIAPIIVSPNAVDMRDYETSMSSRTRTREKLSIGKCVLFGYVGGFHQWHGIGWFVKEITPELKRYKDLKLILVGDGPLFANIKDYIRGERLEDRILLTGRLSHNSIPDVLNALDFAVLPDANEYQSPMKLFEYMASGIGVVAPDTEPIREVVSDGETGWLFPLGDRRKCIDKIVEVSRDGQARRNVGAAARAYIRSHRQWKNNVGQLLEFYNNIQGARGSASAKKGISPV